MDTTFALYFPSPSRGFEDADLRTPDIDLDRAAAEWHYTALALRLKAVGRKRLRRQVFWRGAKNMAQLITTAILLIVLGYSLMFLTALMD